MDQTNIDMTVDSKIKDQEEIFKPIEDEIDCVKVDLGAPYERSIISSDEMIDESVILLENVKVPEAFITFASRVYDFLNSKYTKSNTYLRNGKNGNIHNKPPINLKKSRQKMQYKFVITTSKYTTKEDLVNELESKFNLSTIFNDEKENTVIGKINEDKSYIYSISKVTVNSKSVSYNRNTKTNEYTIIVIVTCYKVNKSILDKMNNNEDKENKPNKKSTNNKDDQVEEINQESTYMSYLSGNYGRPMIDYSSIVEEKSYNESITPNEKYLDILYEYMDMSDRSFAKSLTYITEADQNKVLMSLTSRLYSIIVDKANEIDYGEIPNTKGDITKLSNYDIMKESVKVLRDIIVQYKQDTKQVDILAEAISNVESRKELFESAYRSGVEFPQVMYCTIVISILNGISYLIATCIEFIKTPSSDSYDIVLDTMRYKKSKDYLIHTNLDKLNKTFKNGDFDKVVQEMIKNKSKQTIAANEAVGLLLLKGAIITALALPTLIILISVLIPILRELVFIMYNTSMKVSDYFDMQANLLEINIYNLESNNPTKSNEDLDKIAKKQSKIVDFFRKLSNKFNIESKKAEVNAHVSISKEKEKFNKSDLESVDSSLSSLF